jgi:hypothetical protein
MECFCGIRSGSPASTLPIGAFTQRRQHLARFLEVAAP